MISYAQNREDVVLARLIDLVPVGRFVDVGAGHPVIENVTYALYLAGWRGVNIEPMAREVAMIREIRPEDDTFQVAVGAAPGRVTLFEAPMENRGATTSNEEIVERYRAEGQEFQSFEIEVLPLRAVLNDLPAGDIHVLKIDVEGMEADVIAGADLQAMQPWVLVIEATVPNTKEDSAAEWEADVLAAGYVLTLFDGLNRFYVRNDLLEVQKLMSVPANVFDQWVSIELEQCRSALSEAERYAEDLHEAAKAAAEYAESLEKERKIAAPHVANLKTRAAFADQLEVRLEELLRRLEEATEELKRARDKRAS